MSMQHCSVLARVSGFYVMSTFSIIKHESERYFFILTVARDQKILIQLTKSKNFIDLSWLATIREIVRY